MSCQGYFAERVTLLVQFHTQRADIVTLTTLRFRDALGLQDGQCKGRRLNEVVVTTCLIRLVVRSQEVKMTKDADPHEKSEGSHRIGLMFAVRTGTVDAYCTSILGKIFVLLSVFSFQTIFILV